MKCTKEEELKALEHGWQTYLRSMHAVRADIHYMLGMAEGRTPFNDQKHEAKVAYWFTRMRDLHDSLPK